MLALFIIFCVVGAIASLAWLAIDNDNKQAEHRKKIFLECYNKTNNAEWCYDL